MIYAKDAKAIGASIELAASKGVPTICWDRDADPSVTQANAWIGLDTVDQGYSTGSALFKAMKDAGVEPLVLNVMGATTDNNAINRDTGLKKAATEYGATILQDIPSDWNVDKAQSGLAAALQAHPEANAVFCASDYIWPGMQIALENAGRWVPAGEANHMWVGSQDVYPVAIPLLEQGYMEYNTAFDIWAMATKAADVISDMVDGKEFKAEKFAVKGACIGQGNVDTQEMLWSRDYKD
jgi:ABC-type sugar transport system substrate-binding protein